MRKYFIYLTLLLLTAVVYGQGFTGPGSTGQTIMTGRFISVSEARMLPHDSWVVLTGNIINMLPGGRQYTFRDATGDIVVDIGPKEWRGLSVDAADRVEIFGEVKISRGQIHIKVHAISGTARVNARAGQAVTITRPVMVNEARTLPHDSFVVLTGNIINRLPDGKHNYTFSDATGEITVDIGAKEWRGLSVGVSDRVEIFGEVKINRSQIHIKVHAIGRAGV
ncbi:MAG: NirD/YgiW/YdeI family stress tolerance protein [Treponema sp.]|nr:NirD/YgiW/YdeI family stress tolerance protein [Treponema sp.]